MKHQSCKRLLAFVLAAVMMFSLCPVGVRAAANENLALNRPATASNVEAGTSFTADKAVDGDTTRASRWATDMNVSNPWIEIDLDDGTVIKQINIFFERADADQNILAYKVEAEVDGAYTVIYTHSGSRAKQREKIVLANAVTADKLKLTVTEYDGGQNPVWASVSVTEIEVYAAEVFSLADVAQSLNDMAGTVVTGDTLELPEVPEGITIEMNGADLEQIIAKDLTVHKPLTDKTVNVSFEISDGTNTLATSDIAVVVEGLYSQDEANNAKPVVIPEIQEWYSDSSDKLSVSSLSKVTYDDAALQTVVDEFVSDYESFTGITLTAVQGAAQANAFNFSLTAPDAYLGDEGYTMEILADRINVASGHTTGNMYGMQTILQMTRTDAEGFAIGKMRDYPRFQIRGLLLDMARKPIAMTMISEISRTMRYYKMNDFQLHLSDNLIFLEDYVVWENGVANESGALNAYEAFRLESSLTNENGEDPTAEDYYITKADMADFIQSERALGMNIVPEIDVPAHSLSFTRIWPEIMVTENRNGGRPLLDHFDLTKPAAVDKIKEIFDDYTKGEDPTFDADTTVHIGADEFTYSATSYREYFNTIIPYIKETNSKVRVWGSLTIINDNRTEIIPEAIENVQMNIWNTGWADPQTMYNMGFDVINTIDGSSYMVPSGNFGRGGYGDLLNLNYLFDSFAVNRMGGANLPSGDDQVLGAVFAIWNDNIDTRACGLTESDMFYRFFDALPTFAEKTWAATGTEKGSASALTELSKQIGLAPEVNPYDVVESDGDIHADYTFDGLADASGNGRDLTAGTATVNGALNLTGGDSYVTTPIDKIGNGSKLSFDITLTEEAVPGQILFETTPEYATHDIRIMDDGTLGFTRELYDYSFGYTIPVGETVNIEIVAEQQRTTLYVNGEVVGNATGKFVHNGAEKKTGITNSTFALPLERIGSETNAIVATIDNVRVTGIKDPADDSRDIPVEYLTATAGDWQTGYEATEGPAELVLDGNPSTLWHTDWYGTSRENHWIQFELSEDYNVDGLRYLPREGSSNGIITEYDIQVSEDGENFRSVATGEWANNKSWKVVEFDAEHVKYVRLVSLNSVSDNSYVFASAAEIRLTGEVYVEMPPVQEPDDASWDIPLSELAVDCGDYEPDGGANEGPARLAVDENIATLWHTDWEGTSRENHWFQFEVLGDYTVCGLRYLPRQTGNSNGTITQYEIKVSDDGETWTTVAAGNWEANSSWKISQFPGVKAKYVRLYSIDAVTDNSWVFASAAELRLTYLPTAVSDADKTDLNALIAECEQIEQGNYTAKSWQKFQKALEAARTVAANPYASQAQVDEALAALEAAKAGLKEKVEGEGIMKVLHLDSGRKYYSKDFHIALINELAAAGYTHVQLAFGNNGLRFLLDDMSIEANGTTYASDDVKAGIKLGNDNYGALTGYSTGDAHALTQSEMDEIIAHGKSVGIEVIPHLNMPGHMSALLDAMEYVGIEDPNFYGRVESDSSVDLTNETALNFMSALVEKYAAYFAEKGVKYFHIGADEYANDAYNGSMGFPSMGATLYEKFAQFVNNNAAIVKSHGMTPVAWNDGLYYGSYTSEFDDEIVVDYWSSGWWGYTLSRAATLHDKGHDLINTNGDYYYILGKDDRFTPGSSSTHDPNMYTECAGYDLNAFMDGSTIEDPLGGMFCIWADYPGAETEQEVGANIRLLLRAMSMRMDGLDLDVNTDVVPGGFNEDGTINGSGETCDHANTEVDNVKAATCTEDGYTGDIYCSDCGEKIAEGEVIPATGHTEEVIPGKAPTCTETGLTEGKKCSDCGEILVAQEEIAALGHSYEAVVTAPTCTEGGYTTYTCSVCGDSYVGDETAALGHTEEVLPAVEATCTETGLTEGKKCSVCDEILVAQEVVPALGHDFVNGECSRCDAVKDSPFVDVPVGSFYFDPVEWAVEKGITTGVDANHFNPNGQCQRAVVVTFLWRAAGSPEPTSTNNPFTDVKEADFFYKAVLWAVEKGITNGLTETTFGPYALCNRAQVVTFLWRAQGKPAPTTTENPFSDVVVTEWYGPAVLWAVEKGITNGMGDGTFGVGGICNRAQVVTFLYRAMVK